MVYNPLNFNWDEIFEELREKLNREPTVWEIQEELLRKYWNSIDTIERQS